MQVQWLALLVGLRAANLGSATTTTTGATSSATATATAAAATTTAAAATTTGAATAAATTTSGAGGTVSATTAAGATTSGATTNGTAAGGTNGTATTATTAKATTTTTTISVVQIQVVQTTATVEAPDCNTAGSMSTDPTVKNAFIKTMANITGVPEANVACTTTKKFCRRRLQTELFDSARRKLATPSVQADFSVTAPSGTTTTAISSSISNTQLTDFQNALVQNLANTNYSNTSLKVSSISTPSTSSQLTGYTKCYFGQACYFDLYEANTQYEINSRAAVDLVTCGQQCANTQGCEAFEHIVDKNKKQPSCVFWKAGACDIPNGNPPGFVSGITFTAVTTCERNGTRSTFTQIASKCQRKSILGIVLALLWAFLMGFVTG